MLAAILPMLAAATTSTTPDYPVDAVLAAFAEACANAEEPAANSADVATAGWTRLAADADTPVSRFARKGKAMIAERGGAGTELLEGGEYVKQVSGRTLYLAISGVRSDGVTSRGCRLFDFTAPRAPTPRELAAWSGRKPATPAEAPDGVVRYVWSPGLKPDHTEMETYFIRPGAKVLPGFEASGLALVASVLE